MYIQRFYLNKGQRVYTRTIDESFNINSLSFYFNDWPVERKPNGHTCDGKILIDEIMGIIKFVFREPILLDVCVDVLYLPMCIKLLNGLSFNPFSDEKNLFITK